MKEIRIKPNTTINYDEILNDVISFGIAWNEKSPNHGRITIVNIENREDLDGNGNPWYIGAFFNAITYLLRQKTADKIYLINRKFGRIIFENQSEIEEWFDNNASVVITRRF